MLVSTCNSSASFAESRTSICLRCDISATEAGQKVNVNQDSTSPLILPRQVSNAGNNRKKNNNPHPIHRATTGSRIRNKTKLKCARETAGSVIMAQKTTAALPKSHHFAANNNNKKQPPTPPHKAPVPVWSTAKGQQS